MDKIKFGIIGLGNQGSHYLFSLFNKGEIINGIVTAVCDNNKAKLDSVKSKINDNSVKFFTDYKKMLDKSLVDVILIETPHYFHPQMVIDCLAKDINVICDKPAGVYTKQVRLMNEAAAKSKAKFAMMFNQRTNCLYKKMREIIQGGEIGDLQRVTWIITDWYRTQHYYDTGSWRATWQGEGGGVLINQCPHQLDLLSWVIGKMPATVQSFCKYGKWHDIEVEDDVTAYLEYANGATGVFISSTGETPGANRLEVSGTKGKLVAEYDQLTFFKNNEDSGAFLVNSQEVFARPQYEIIKVAIDGSNPQHAGVINNFANSLLGLESLLIDGKEGINGVELMNAIELSGWLNSKKISIPVNEDIYLKELTKRRKQSILKKVDDNVVSNTAGTYGSIK